MFQLHCRVVGLLVVGMGANVAALADESSSAPEVAYTLIIDGQPHVIVPDQPLKLTGAFENPKVTLRVAQERDFQAAGVTFRYPAYFTYEADTSDAEVQTWTVSGNDVTVILFQLSEWVSAEDLTKSTAEALAAKLTDTKKITLELGGKEYSGVKATMELASLSVIQQCIRLPTTGSGSRMLVIQEVRADDEQEAAELSAFIKLLASTLEIQR